MKKSTIILLSVALLLVLAMVGFCQKSVAENQILVVDKGSEVRLIGGKSRAWIWPWQARQSFAAKQGIWSINLELITGDDISLEVEVLLGVPSGRTLDVTWPPGQEDLLQRLNLHQASYGTKDELTEFLNLENGGMTGWFRTHLPGQLSELLLEAKSTNLSRAFQRKALAAPLLQASVPAPPILLVGWDGADWNLAGPLMAQGKMPNLARLTQAGSSGTMISQKPVFSPLLWTTMATGVTPDQHGILDFIMIDSLNNGETPITSMTRRTPALWNMFDGAGKKSAFVAWWATYPAEEVSGAMVSDRLFYQMFGHKSGDLWGQDLTYPQDLLVGLGVKPIRPQDLELEFVRRFVPDLSQEELSAALVPLEGEEKDLPKLTQLLRSLAKADNYHQVSLAIWDNLGPLDLVSPYYEAIDEIAHRFMPFQGAIHPWSDQAEAKKYSRVVEATYQLMDDYLKDWLGRFDLEKSHVLVVSDHGFYSEGSKPRHSLPNFADEAPLWHNLFGMFAVAGPGVKKGQRGVLDLSQVAPLVLALGGLPQAADFASPAPEYLLVDSTIKIPKLDSYRKVIPNDWQNRPKSVALDPEAEARMLEDLIALGYISAEALSGMEGGEKKQKNKPGLNSSDFLYRPMAFLNLGVVLLERGMLEEADQHFRNALASPILLVQNIRLMAELGLAWDRGDVVYPRVKEFLLAAKPAQQAHLYDVFCQSAVGAGKVEEAWDIFSQLSGKEIGSSRWAVGHAYLMRSRQGASVTLDFLQDHMQQHPEQMGVAKLFFDFAQESGELSSRASVFAAWAKTAPDSCRTRVWAGTGLLFAGRDPAGISLLDKAYERNPAAAETALDVAQQWAGRFPEASMKIDVWARDKAPWRTDSWLRLARLQIKQGENELAQKALQRVLEVNPDHAEATMLLQGLG